MFESNVKSELFVAERRVLESFAKGIHIDDGKRRVTGYLDEKDRLNVCRHAPDPYSFPGGLWKWLKAMETAFSILTSRDVRLLRRTLQRKGRSFEEISIERKIESLEALSLTNAPNHVANEELMRLTDFLAAKVSWRPFCQHIFWQLHEAVQLSFSACELLCGTILEAALRTIDKVPFAVGVGPSEIRCPKRCRQVLRKVP